MHKACHKQSVVIVSTIRLLSQFKQINTNKMAQQNHDLFGSMGRDSQFPPLSMPATKKDDSDKQKVGDLFDLMGVEASNNSSAG